MRMLLLLTTLFTFSLIFVAESRSDLNVLMIVVDDLRPALGCYGDVNAHTPNIDGLAEKAFIFTNVFAQQAVCAPSRNSFLTSRRPDSLHLYDFYSYWRDSIGNFTTLPQHFKENGYYTKSIGKVFHPGISSNNTDDFPYSWSEIPYHAPSEINENTNICLGTDGKLYRNLICPVINDKVEVFPDQEILNEATNFLQNYNNNNRKNETKPPYFLAVGFHKPHIPFRFPSQYLKYHPRENITLIKNRFRPGLLPTVAWNPWTDLRWRDDISKLNVSFPYGPMPDEIIIDIMQSYYASTSYIDDLIGNLLKNVDKSNTIIMLFGDHGWSMSEHGEFSKYSNFDVATRVPLILHVPQLSQEKLIIKEQVELVDIFPTLVDLTKVSDSLKTCKRFSFSKLCTEGQSLVPLLFGKSRSKSWKQAVFMQYPRPGVLPTLKPNSDKPRLKEISIMGYSIRTNHYRYTEWIGFNHTTFTANWSLIYGKELYDHTIDPQENLNLATRSIMNDVMHRLRIKLILGWRYA